MSMDVLSSQGIVGVAVAGLVALFLLDSILRGFANRFAARPDQYRCRIGTQLPRVCK
jgi:hypothetical protein